MYVFDKNAMTDTVKEDEKASIHNTEKEEETKKQKKEGYRTISYENSILRTSSYFQIKSYSTYDPCPQLNTTRTDHGSSTLPVTSSLAYHRTEHPTALGVTHEKVPLA
jgi:hypothetical protein